ncbi:uncharacterized protein K444DRAFT_619694 [Hyaloscypha bicolor E]|uniref:Uncharacterized protein n=1 Tax=Hyaloscypha bicolor E TaxID=1095630 RepID=A0A2J6SQH3_9HELO|nr:uncharacterized protein K444DRAFT_619694 [Hyaloscypha bicolor E]PMD53017.1 hypothetical protein K444DRAFT_619694 [Hyaloscypha bicolor E]
MGRAVELGGHDPRNALIACLLSFSIENSQGHQSPASSLASSGVALFHDWIGKANGGPQHVHHPMNT